MRSLLNTCILYLCRWLAASCSCRSSRDLVWYSSLTCMHAWGGRKRTGVTVYRAVIVTIHSTDNVGALLLGVLNGSFSNSQLELRFMTITFTKTLHSGNWQKSSPILQNQQKMCQCRHNRYAVPSYAGSSSYGGEHARCMY